MLIATGKSQEGSTLFIGLSRESILSLLTAGNPVYFTREHCGAMPWNLNIAIIFGDSEDAIEKRLRASGLLGEHEQVRVNAGYHGPRIKEVPHGFHLVET